MNHLCIECRVNEARIGDFCSRECQRKHSAPRRVNGDTPIQHKQVNRRTPNANPNDGRLKG